MVEGTGNWGVEREEEGHLLTSSHLNPSGQADH